MYYKIIEKTDEVVKIEVEISGVGKDMRTYSIRSYDYIAERIKANEIIVLDNCYVDNFRLSKIFEAYSISLDTKIMITAKNTFFNGISDFSKVSFRDGDISFRGSYFGIGNIYFYNARFGKGDVCFDRVNFGEGNLFFNSVNFGEGNISFKKAELRKGHVSFNRSIFESGTVDFSLAKFREGVIKFENANFGTSDVYFTVTNFGKGDVSFNGTVFGDGKVDFGSSIFGEGDVDFGSSIFGEGDVIFDLAEFGKGIVTFNGASFGKGDVSFLGTNFGDEDIFFGGINFGKGKVSFIRSKFGNGIFSFGGSNCGEGKLSFFETSFGNGEAIFYNSKLGDVTFECAIGKYIRISNCKLLNTENLMVQDVKILIIEDCIIDTTIDLRKPARLRKIITVSNIGILDIRGTVNLGQIQIDWNEQNVKEMIYNQGKSSSYLEKSKQFVLLKENFRNMGRYDEEDQAYYEFKNCKMKSDYYAIEWNERLDEKYDSDLLKILFGGLNYAWQWLTYPLRVVLFKWIGGYGTRPINVFISMIVTWILFWGIYEWFPGIEFSYDGDIDKIQRLYFSVITFLTVGFGDIKPMTDTTAAFAMIEGFLGIFLMSYFTVSFVRKLLR